MFNDAIYISIKPVFSTLIESGEKNYEFRKYKPKREIQTLFVYESSPLSRLTYLIELGDIVEYPTKIEDNGYGNSDFNEGLKVSKYAYFIKKVYKLKKPILLEELKDFGFSAPQVFAYDSKYDRLTNYIINQPMELVIDRTSKER